MSGTGEDSGEDTQEELTPHADPQKPLVAPVLGRERSRNPNVKQDVFSLAEGEVVLSWPTPLSAESINDLKDWLQIMQRKITRSLAKEESPPDTDK